MPMGPSKHGAHRVLLPMSQPSFRCTPPPEEARRTPRGAHPAPFQCVLVLVLRALTRMPYVVGPGSVAAVAAGDAVGSALIDNDRPFHPTGAISRVPHTSVSMHALLRNAHALQEPPRACTPSRRPHVRDRSLVVRPARSEQTSTSPLLMATCSTSIHLNSVVVRRDAAST